MVLSDEGDYWTSAALTGAAGDAAHSQPALRVHTIENVAPLDAQFGVSVPITVPAALRDALFGQGELIKGRAILPLHTYAILDAAKVMGLVEMLETSGLDHTCLFKGEAAQELRDVAPYLVRLEEANAFTRNLFTKGDAGWQMWDREPGIYLRSQASLDELRRHFRKFTKAQDEHGKWLYFRFWDRGAQEAIAHAVRDRLHEIERLFITSHSDQIMCAYFPSCNTIITSERIKATDTALTAQKSNAFLAVLLKIIKQQRVHHDLSAIAGKIAAGAYDSMLMRALEMLFKAGFTNKAQLLQLGQIEFASGFRFLGQLEVYSVIYSQEPRYAAFVRLIDIAALQESVHGAG